MNEAQYISTEKVVEEDDPWLPVKHLLLDLRSPKQQNHNSDLVSMNKQIVVFSVLKC